MDNYQDITENEMKFISSLKNLHFPQKLDCDDDIVEFYSKIIGPTRERKFLIEWLLTKFLVIFK